MRICVPIVDNLGLLSYVAPHFGSAPAYLVVDTATLAFHPIPNRPHERDRCDPYRALEGERIDAFIVIGIGARALAEIARRRLWVYGSLGGRVADVLADYLDGSLKLLRDATDGPTVGH